MTDQIKSATSPTGIKAALTTVQTDYDTNTTHLAAYSTTNTKSAMVHFSEQYDSFLSVTDMDHCVTYHLPYLAASRCMRGVPDKL